MAKIPIKIDGNEKVIITLNDGTRIETTLGELSPELTEKLQRIMIYLEGKL